MSTRWVVVMFAALVAVALAGVALVIREATTTVVEERSRAPDRPSTDRERRARDIALRFVSALRAGDATRACGLLGRSALSDDFRCRRDPRIPSRYKVPRRQHLQVLEVAEPITAGAIAIGIPVGSLPIMRVEIDQRGRVVHVAGYGYAVARTRVPMSAIA